jgi:glycosyltransferase involved in cell wall biosynthesis
MVARLDGSSPARLLMVTPRFSPEVGGVERHVEEVAGRLAADGCDVTVLCTDRSGALPRVEPRDGYVVERVRAWPAKRDYHFAPAIYQRIVHGGWDLVHVQSYHTLVAPLAMAAAARTRTPFVVTFHGGGHSSAARDAVRGPQRRILGPLLRRAARLVAIARFEIDRYGLELGVGPERFAFIPNGLDMVDGARELPPTEEPGTLIASIGRLERYKGHHRIVAALPHIRAERPDARLWIAGTGPYETDLRELAARLGVGEHVEIRAFADRAALASRLLRTDLVVLLSDFETHPIAVLEAIGLGRRVVVADNSGLAEVAERGLARSVATDAAPEDVAAAVLAALDAPAPPQDVELPTWDDCVAGLLGLYGEVLGRDPRAAERRPSQR